MPTAIPLDRITGAQVVMDVEHHEIHNGNAYTCHYEVTGTGATKMTAIAFITGAEIPAVALGQGLIHMTVDAGADDEAVLRIVEGPSMDLDEGTDLDVFNRDRGSADFANITTVDAAPTVYHASYYGDVAAAGANITITAANTLHYETIGQSGNPVSSFGGRSRGEREFILLPETQYIVILTRSTANATFCEITLNFYQTVDNKYRS